MSKQLVMESYVDECLDEVEIRDLFITEGVMDSPNADILRQISDKLSRVPALMKRTQNELISAQKELAKKREVAEKIRSTMSDMKNSREGGQFALHNRDAWITKYDGLKGKLRDIDETKTVNKIKNKKSYIEYLKNAEKRIMKLKTDLNKDFLGNVPYLYQIIGATMIVAAIGYASYKLYKRFMSKAAKACQDKKGKVKTICMNQYQLKALEASKKPFTDGMKNCSKAKEVQACKAKFNKKINAINKRITKKQNQIKKLASK